MTFDLTTWINLALAGVVVFGIWQALQPRWTVTIIASVSPATSIAVPGNGFGIS